MLKALSSTTFVSVLFAVANSLRMQETVALILSDYLTAETGIQIIFESAIVPKWKDSRICFENVYVSRRPGNSRRAEKGIDGSREAARLLTIGDHSHDAYQDHSHDDIGKDGPTEGASIIVDPPDDVTYFDLNIDSVAVTLSLWRWWNGKGIITDAEIKGVRGIVDRRHLTAPVPADLDPATTRYVAQPGDFQLESLKLEDILITIYQPNFRPINASIFRADLSHFRKQWVFYDLISADNMVGQFDNCLFSVHQPQSINRTKSGDSKDSTWNRMSRFRIDGVNIDHVQYLTGTDGPIAWITAGKVDSVVDIRFGRDPAEEVDIQALLGEIAANISAAATGSPSPDPSNNDGLNRHAALLPPPVPERIPGQRELARPALTAPSEDTRDIEGWQTPSQVVIDIDLRFRDLKAAVPIFTNDLSYTRNALIRPIVAFINANRTLVPIRCRIVKDLKEFNGSWTIWQTGLSDDVAVKTYDALAHHVVNANQRRLKTVSLWSLRMTAGAISSALKNIVDSHSPKPLEGEIVVAIEEPGQVERTEANFWRHMQDGNADMHNAVQFCVRVTMPDPEDGPRTPSVVEYIECDHGSAQRVVSHCDANRDALTPGGTMETGSTSPLGLGKGLGDVSKANGNDKANDPSGRLTGPAGFTSSNIPAGASSPAPSSGASVGPSTVLSPNVSQDTTTGPSSGPSRASSTMNGDINSIAAPAGSPLAGSAVDPALSATDRTHISGAPDYDIDAARTVVPNLSSPSGSTSNPGNTNSGDFANPSPGHPAQHSSAQTTDTSGNGSEVNDETSTTHSDAHKGAATTDKENHPGGPPDLSGTPHGSGKGEHSSTEGPSGTSGPKIGSTSDTKTSTSPINVHNKEPNPAGGTASTKDKPLLDVKASVKVLQGSKMTVPTGENVVSSVPSLPYSASAKVSGALSAAKDEVDSISPLSAHGPTSSDPISAAKSFQGSTAAAVSGTGSHNAPNVQPEPSSLDHSSAKHPNVDEPLQKANPSSTTHPAGVLPPTGSKIVDIDVDVTKNPGPKGISSFTASDLVKGSGATSTVSDKVGKAGVGADSLTDKTSKVKISSIPNEPLDADPSHGKLPTAKDATDSVLELKAHATLTKTNDGSVLSG
ncbi:Mitochondrial distribution and morphology protein 31, mitochondrial precursor [Tulasnella sp. 403]|nr:Mitochondrial distribution and morphology protein 31, mitochondrial precursor [Tulasnella sp. 403]